MAAVAPCRFGMSEFTTQPLSFEQDVALYARLGVDTIEVCEEKLDARRAADQLALIRQHGLTISSVQPAVRTLYPSASQPAPHDVAERLSRFRRTIRLCADAGTNLAFVTNTGIPPQGNVQEVVARAAHDYRGLAEFAQEQGARIALEPLNASLMNVESAIWTLEQALEIVAAVDRPNFGICLDYWNIWQNADIAEVIAGCGDRIFVVQVSDWRTPCSFQDRLIPGQGAIPLAPLLRATHQSGYRGAYAVEIFSTAVPDALWEADPAWVITQSRTGLEAAWRAALAA